MLETFLPNNLIGFRRRWPIDFKADLEIFFNTFNLLPSHHPNHPLLPKRPAINLKSDHLNQTRLKRSKSLEFERRRLELERR